MRGKEEVDWYKKEGKGINRREVCFKENKTFVHVDILAGLHALLSKMFTGPACACAHTGRLRTRRRAHVQDCMLSFSRVSV